MRLIRSTVMTALAVLALIGAPLSQVMVWCQGDDGHQAVELAGHDHHSHSDCGHSVDHHGVTAPTHHQHDDVAHYHGSCEDWQLGVDHQPTPARPMTLVYTFGAIASGTCYSKTLSTAPELVTATLNRPVASSAAPPLHQAVTNIILLI